MRLAEILAEEELFALMIFHADKIKEAVCLPVIDTLDLEVHAERIKELVSILDEA